MSITGFYTEPNIVTLGDQTLLDGHGSNGFLKQGTLFI